MFRANELEEQFIWSVLLEKNIEVRWGKDNVNVGSTLFKMKVYSC